MSYVYKTQGTCSTYIEVEMDGDIIKEVQFTGGCNGNLKAISTLVKGMRYDEVVDKLQGITCGFKETSCGDQLSQALTAAMEAEKKQA